LRFAFSVKSSFDGTSGSDRALFAKGLQAADLKQIAELFFQSFSRGKRRSTRIADRARLIASCSASFRALEHLLPYRARNRRLGRDVQELTDGGLLRNAWLSKGSLTLGFDAASSLVMLAQIGGVVSIRRLTWAVSEGKVRQLQLL
jgi:hypothetical protein